MTPPSAEELAIQFHNIYERLAPSFGYSTRTETRQFDPITPNGRLMIAVCGEILTQFRAAEAAARDEQREMDAKISESYGIQWPAVQAIAQAIRAGTETAK